MSPGRVVRRPRDRGASAVEFALVATLLFTLLFGVLEFGRGIWVKQGVSAASREGSRFGVATGTNSGVAQYRDCDAIKQAAIQKVPDLGLAAADVQVSYELYAPSASPTAAPTSSPSCSTSSPSLKNGDKVVVVVTKQVDLNLPLVPLGPYTVTSRTERTLYLGGTP